MTAKHSDLDRRHHLRLDWGRLALCSGDPGSVIAPCDGLGGGQADPTQLATDALKMALLRRRPTPELVFHSNRYSQYASFDFRQLLENSDITGSMSRNGDPCDNAVVQSFFARLKSDHVFRRHYKIREETKRGIVDYIEIFYNSSRLHLSQDNLCPR